jgi:hypothetical protein
MTELDDAPAGYIPKTIAQAARSGRGGKVAASPSGADAPGLQAINGFAAPWLPALASPERRSPGPHIREAKVPQSEATSLEVQNLV